LAVRRHVVGGLVRVGRRRRNGHDSGGLGDNNSAAISRDALGSSGNTFRGSRDTLRSSRNALRSGRDALRSGGSGLGGTVAVGRNTLRGSRGCSGR
jgi:hypothetical protein